MRRIVLALALPAAAAALAQTPPPSAFGGSTPPGSPVVMPPVAYLGDARLAPATRCADIVSATTPIVTIDSAVDQAAGPFTQTGPAGARIMTIPAHCLVRGTIERRTGADGKPYGIHFELRMPTTWNGRFLFQGGGGINGVVTPALGLVKGPAALARGFAVVTQDAGHGGRDASFGADSQARIDMIYRSYVRVTTEAKRLVSAYYGRAPDRSYFMGCSEGGREALLMSQRQPLDYDGVVAGDPGFLLGVSFDDVAGRMAITRISPPGSDGKPDLARAFSPAQLTLLRATVDAECDALDGLKDGIVDSAPICRPRLERLLCADGKAGDECLSRGQIDVLRDIFDGGLPAGHGVTARGYYYNNQLDLPQWQGKLAGFGGLPTPPVSSIQGLFVSPYQVDYDDFAIDFARDGARFDEVGGMNRADGVSYSSFAARGSKLLIYTGLADAGFSAKTLVAWYERMSAANGGAAAGGFARLFLAPGMLHCRGGNALDDFDPLPAVVDWVEHGRAPDRLVATGAAFPGRSRPICPYPLQSRYKGPRRDRGRRQFRVPRAGCAVTRAIVAALAVALLGAAPVDHEAETRAIAQAFVAMQFDRGDVKGAKARWFAPDYVQHNPEIASGLQADSAFFEARRRREPGRYLPVAQWRNVNDHLLVQGKYFALHHHLFTGPDDPGRIFFDLWRVENGRIVEHWDIIQPVAAAPLNANTMWSDKVASAPARNGEPAAEAVVRAYLRIGLDEHDPRRAAQLCIADAFVQHSPHIADGKAALLAYFAAREGGGAPERTSSVTHIVADGDLVAVTRHVMRAPGDKGVMYADLFRVRRGRIVEHWDVIQDVPDRSVNGNTMW